MSADELVSSRASGASSPKEDRSHTDKEEEEAAGGAAMPTPAPSRRDGTALRT